MEARVFAPLAQVKLDRLGAAVYLDLRIPTIPATRS